MIRLGLLVLGVYHAALGLFMALAPKRFYGDFGSFPPRNDHYIRDVSTFYIALGVVMAMASGRRAWRLPVLLIAVGEYALHVLNHLLDIGDADPAWQGPVDAISLAVVGAALFELLRQTRREGSGPVS